nr:EAL domain-containing protein [Microvirga antarctica]
MSSIIIVDDQATNRNLFARLAKSISSDISVNAFADPLSALSWLSENTPDLIISDYKMPQMDGAEFIRRIRQIPSLIDLPVVVVTVYEDREFRLQALEAGATDFLQSPVDHHEFATRARNLLKMRHQQLLLASRADGLERELEHSERSRVQALRDSSERLAQVIDTVPAMISAADRDGKILFTNEYQTRLLGLDPAKVVGQDATALFGDEQGARSKSLDRVVWDTGRPISAFEEEFSDRAGETRTVLTTKSPLRTSTDAITAVLTTSMDISERKQAEAHLHHITHHDTLTGLPNRVLLQERLNAEIVRSRRGNRTVTLHLIDLDSFKPINDVLGHTAGDRFLIETAKRLTQLVGKNGTVARLGGDEFAVMQTGTGGAEEASELAARIGQTVSEPYEIFGTPIATTASIGIALHPHNAANVEDLLRSADLAMYQAKSDGGNLHRFYVEDMTMRAREAAALDAELKQAIADEQFTLYYQPRMDLSTGMIVGAEALLRWHRPGIGIVAPGVFLPRVEESGLILPLGEWVLKEACQRAKQWQGAGLPTIRVSVNLSALQFRKQDVPALVAKTLATTGLAPDLLELEITESIMLEDTEAVVRDLHGLRELGVSISIDDFGVGYSSLQYVKNLPVDRIKVDRCFIRNITTDPNDAAILRAIVSLGHSLDLAIVGEGVETAEQLAHLRIEGCDEGQGYYLGKPMPFEEFIAFVKADSKHVHLA